MTNIILGKDSAKFVVHDYYVQMTYDENTLSLVPQTVLNDFENWLPTVFENHTKVVDDGKVTVEGKLLDSFMKGKKANNELAERFAKKWELQDFFMDAKITKQERESVAVEFTTNEDGTVTIDKAVDKEGNDAMDKIGNTQSKKIDELEDEV